MKEQEIAVQMREAREIVRLLPPVTVRTILSFTVPSERIRPLRLIASMIERRERKRRRRYEFQKRKQ